jgi:hypothetical protein
MAIDDSALTARLEAAPLPEHLFHYTSPAGLIGICSSRSLGTTAMAFLNDTREQLLGIDTVRRAFEARVQPAAPDAPERFLLPELVPHLGRRTWTFVFSMTGLRDSLEQWRAYCPPAGGYALGLPASRLGAIANEHGFRLVKCVYDHGEQWRIANEIVDVGVAAWRDLVAQGVAPDEAARTLRTPFLVMLGRHVPVFKDPAFAQEEEWRMVTESDPYDERIGFHPGVGTAVPHLAMPLTGPVTGSIHAPEAGAAIGLVVGPSTRNLEGQIAAQTILHRFFGPGCWHGSSAAPYRGI